MYGSNWQKAISKYRKAKWSISLLILRKFLTEFGMLECLGYLLQCRHYNVPAKLCALIRSLYDQAVSAVRVGKDISDWFNQTVGVRQGCTLSPDLFNVFLENILSEAKVSFDDEFGVQVNGERLTDLCFVCMYVCIWHLLRNHIS